MASNPVQGSEYEFDEPQSNVIRSLARRMGGVAFLIVALGAIQIAHGLFASYLGYRDPGKLEAAAKAQLPPDQFEKFQKTLGSPKITLSCR